MASFINTQNEKERMKIMFLRESEGVYQFGQSKVYVRVEQGNKVSVKVGGGFMTAKDFVEKFQPLELEKLHKRTSKEALTNRYQSTLKI